MKNYSISRISGERLINEKVNSNEFVNCNPHVEEGKTYKIHYEFESKQEDPGGGPFKRKIFHIEEVPEKILEMEAICRKYWDE